jgi:exoribonuclease-2
MPERIPRQDSLVLYKTRAALVRHARKRLQIELEDGETLKVRLKDVVVLHPGPLGDLSDLQPQKGELEAAWELLAGTTTDLAELCELAFGEYTPDAAWAAWQWVADGLYFHGSPETVVARSQEELASERATREARAAEARAWESFLERLRLGKTGPEDAIYLREVEELAWGQRTKSRALKKLGRTESPETAHALLLEIGYWDQGTNPYPRRLRLPTKPVRLELPLLPHEPRLDLTHLPAYAIDDEGNQEPDDALSLDGDRLWVHVADVAALVAPNSPVDREAMARGASLYLP